MRHKEQRDEFDRLQREGMEIADKALSEKRDLTEDEQKAVDEKYARCQQLKKALDADAKFASMAIASAVAVGTAAAAGAPIQPGNVQLPQEAPGREEFVASRQGGEQFALRPGETPEQAANRYHREAVNRFIRNGQMPDARFVVRGDNKDPQSEFTLITTSGSSVLAPARVGPPITLMRQRNPFRAALMARGLQPLRTTDSASINAPVFDDSANTADVIAQNATGDNPADPTITALAVNASLYDSKTVWVSNMLAEQTSFDLMGYLEPLLDERIDQAQTAAWITLLEAGTVGKTTASTTGVTYAELLDWQHSIPLQRRGDGVFFVSDGLLRAIRGLVDDEGRPLFQVSLRDDVPDTLLGWPIFPVAGLDAPAAGAVSGVAASASALIVRDVTGPNGARRIARYANQPDWPDQIGIRMFQNGGFNFVTSYVRTLKHAAS